MTTVGGIEGLVDCLTSEAERHVASPPHEALWAVAASADANTCIEGFFDCFRMNRRIL